MARSNKLLSDVFLDIGRKDQNKSTQFNNENVTSNVILKSNTETIEEEVTENSTIRNQQGTDERLSNTSLTNTAKKDLLSLYEEKVKKETVENTHKRTTFLLRKDLDQRLEKLTRNKRGFKTIFLNKAIENLLDELEH